MDGSSSHVPSSSSGRETPDGGMDSDDDKYDANDIDGNLLPSSLSQYQFFTLILLFLLLVLLCIVFFLVLVPVAIPTRLTDHDRARYHTQGELVVADMLQDISVPDGWIKVATDNQVKIYRKVTRISTFLYKSN
jgi:hypothetical protein